MKLFFHRLHHVIHWTVGVLFVFFLLFWFWPVEFVGAIVWLLRKTGRIP